MRYAKQASGRYPAKDFLDDLEKRDSGSFDKFMRVFEKFQEHGPEGTVGLYKALQTQSGIIQFTIWKYRILGFRDGESVFLTNGFKKDQFETPAEELERARRIKKEHQQAMPGGKP